MQLKQLLKAVWTLKDSSGLEDEITDLVYDSRKATPGTMFFCLRGAKTDGHRYAVSAYENGCRHFVCDHPLDLPIDATQFCFDDTRATLADLSAAFYGYPAKQLTLIGVTGTKGKSTVATFIHQILNLNGKKCGLIGTTGAYIGDEYRPTANTTPESKELHKLFREMVNAGLKYCVMEVSSQAYLTGRVRGLQFEEAVFTNLSPDHIGPGEHRDFHDYQACKAALFRHTSHAVLNGDDGYSAAMIAGAECERSYYGLAIYHPEKGEDKTWLLADTVTRWQKQGRMGIGFDYRYGGIRYTVSLPLPGIFNVYNALAAAAVCRRLGLTHPNIALALEQVCVKGRFETVQLPGYPDTTFIIDYAHNGISLRSILEEIRSYRPRRVVCLFGSVGGRTEIRRKELGEVAAELADLSILTADNPDFEDPVAICDDIAAVMSGADYVIVPDRAEAVRHAVRIARAGDVILFAGKGHEDYQLIKGEKVPFSERQILTETVAMLARNA